MKKTFRIILSLVILTLTLSFAVTAERFVTVKLDGKVLEFDVQPQIINGRTMVPLRKIFESMGAEVDWDDSTRTAFAEKNTRFVEAQIDNHEMKINGFGKMLDTAPMLLGGRTLVPARFVAEAFGAVVDWDDATSTVSITSAENIKLSGVIPLPYDYDLSEYVSLERKDYTGVEYTYDVPKVTEDDIYDALCDLLLEYTQYVDTTAPCEFGDRVNIDYKGFIDGFELENGSDEDVELILGEGSFIDGFESGIVGHSVGETFVVDIVFPEDYGNEELNGAPAKFRITINSVQDVITPPLNDEFIASVTEFKTLDEYVEGVELLIKQEKWDTAIYEKKTELFDSVVKKADIMQYPQAEYTVRYNGYVADYKEMANEYGVDFEVFLTEYLEVSVDEFYSVINEYAQDTVSIELVSFYIASKENMINNLTKADYIQYVDVYSKAYEMSFEDFEKEYGIELIVKSFVLENVMDYILINGIAK